MPFRMTAPGEALVRQRGRGKAEDRKRPGDLAEAPDHVLSYAQPSR